MGNDFTSPSFCSSLLSSALCVSEEISEAGRTDRARTKNVTDCHSRKKLHLLGLSSQRLVAQDEEKASGRHCEEKYKKSKVRRQSRMKIALQGKLIVEIKTGKKFHVFSQPDPSNRICLE